MSKIMNISQEEKNRILEMHNSVKSLISEQTLPIPNSVIYTDEKARYKKFLESIIRQLGTNEANEVLNPDPTAILMNVINETNKLLNLYKKTLPQKQKVPQQTAPKKVAQPTAPPTKTEPLTFNQERKKERD